MVQSLSNQTVITSPRNPRVRSVVALRKKRRRVASELFLAEGAWPLRMAMAAGITPVTVYYCREILAPGESHLISEAEHAGAEVIEVGLEAMERMSYRDGPDGILATFRSWRATLSRIHVKPRPLVLVVETIEKPGNLGSMVRTACAANADAVIVCDPQTDPFGPGVVRASLGTIFTTPIAVCTSHEALAWLRKMDIAIVAATPQGNRLLWDTPMQRATAIAIGNEHRGLSTLWMEAANEQVKIPMLGAINSLNATMAAGILLYEAINQRMRLPG
jgi:TrmH family RNA methyltransferase